IQLVRNGSTHGVASVDFITTTNGTAIAGTNYLAVTNTVVFAAGKSNVTVQVPILHNPVPEGPRTVQLMLTNALNTVLFDPSMAELTIQDVDNAPGQLYFSATNYVALEGQGHMPVTILRTNGFSGVISVNFAAIPGTALPNIKYWPTNGSLTFGDGEMSKTFTLPIIDDSIVGGSSSLTLRLSGASGGATILPPATTPVTILDNDPGITFSSAAYVVAETESSVFLTVFRTNAAMGTTTVKYATTNVTALAGTNYGSTSGTLTFANGESIKTFSIPIMDDPRVTGNLSFSVSLFDPSVPAQLLDPSTTVVNITDSDPGITFVSTNSFVYTNFDSTLSTNAAFAAVKSGTNVLITVLRSNANTGIVTVNYATSNRTAVAGVDYTATSGLLTFSNGVSLQSFTVPIVNNRLVQGDRAFDINLFNPSTGVQLVAPARATVVITDDISGLQFSAPAYSLAENGVAATISVLRTSFTNSTVSVNYSTANGTALAGVNYVAATGTLTFTNGEVMKTFTVPVIDNTVVDGDHTVLLSLSDPVGNALLVEPSAATLSVLEADGSLIVPAGSAIQAESGPVNGVIDPGETVTMLLSLRNASGTNTANLVATLVSSTSVSNPSGPQNYGNLSVRGASAFRPFTFTANGTNGQPLNVVLQLEDNGRSMSNVVYALSIGNIPSVWSNSTAIVINDFTNATPYPSVINVSGINGTVNKATVTLTNFNHTWPRDVNAILVAPGGQKSYLMAKAGSSVAANNVTLTFDDAAPAALPFSSALVSGTYRPSAYSAAPPPFPVPAPPPPYATNLSVFNGSNPNGAWSLYVYDDKGWDYGMISNGWILRLHTGAPAAADAGLAMVAAPTTVVAGSNVSFTLSVANFGPGNASNIVVSDVLPAAYVSGNASQGTFATNGAGLLTWNLGALSPNANATLNVVVQPTVPGLITNVATLNTSTTDLNLDNNAASAIVNVVVPTADLVLGLSGAPNPILVGGLVTYAITVTNLGPATASGVSISDTLPPGFVFVSASPVAPVVSGRNITFANLGDLSSGSHSIVSVVA
ncbi:MAG TPA: Calx-beta domain-containing protein, partial [Clostridia bacterium]|nr:Calx-beta domain-containing protein [Clostridia bacterium]